MGYDATLPFQRRTMPAGYGGAFRQAREARGLSRREVAAAVAIAPRTLARVERGQQVPLWATLEKLCGHLGVSVVAVARRWFSDSLDVPTDPRSSPGVGLRALRHSRRMTLEDLALRSGVSAATISRFERGLTVSRRLASRSGGSEVDRDDRGVVLDSRRVAEAFGLKDAAALRAACLAAAGGQGGQRGY